MTCSQARAKKIKERKKKALKERRARELTMRMSFEDRDEHDRKIENELREQHVFESRWWQDAHDEYR